MRKYSYLLMISIIIVIAITSNSFSLALDNSNKDGDDLSDINRNEVITHNELKTEKRGRISRERRTSLEAIERSSKFTLSLFPRFAIWRTFHSIEMELIDFNGSLKAHACALKTAQTDEEEEEEEEGNLEVAGVDDAIKTTSSSKKQKKASLAIYRKVKMKQKGDHHDDAEDGDNKKRTTLVAQLNPFQEKTTYVLQCDGSGGGSSKTTNNLSWKNNNKQISYEIGIRYYFDSDLFGRFLAGVCLMLLAPVIATSPWCFYVAAISLSTAMLLSFFVLQLTRLSPRARATRAVFGIGSTLATTIAYHFVPLDKWKIVIEYFWKGASMPVRASWNVVKNVDTEEPKTLYVAIFIVAFFLLSSGLGITFVKKYVVDDRTGKVYKSWKSFTSFAISFYGVILLKFCTRDPRSGNTLAFLAGSTIIVGPAAAFAKDLKRTLRLAFHAFTFNLLKKKEMDDEIHSDDDEDDETEVEFLRRLPSSMDPEPRVAPSRFQTPLKTNENENAKERLSLSPFSLVKRLNPFNNNIINNNTKNGGAESSKNVDDKSLSSPQRTTSATNNSDEINKKKKSPPPFSATKSSSAEKKTKVRSPPSSLACASKGRFLTSEEADEQALQRTESALTSLAQSPEFAQWLVRNASKIRMVRDDDD